MEVVRAGVFVSVVVTVAVTVGPTLDVEVAVCVTVSNAVVAHACTAKSST